MFFVVLRLAFESLHRLYMYQKFICSCVRFSPNALGIDSCFLNKLEFLMYQAKFVHIGFLESILSFQEKNKVRNPMI